MEHQAPRRPLLGLLVSQFFGAFNDNAWKLIVITLGFSVIPTIFNADFMQKQYVAMLALVAFTVPMALFSIPAGSLADRLSKRSVILATKLVEVLLMAAGMAVLCLESIESTSGTMLSVLVMFGVLVLMGVQSAIFSPAKYGLIPEMVPHEKLTQGNALLEMWTMIAIIAGTGLGTVLLALGQSYYWFAGLQLTLFAVAGLVAALYIPQMPAARPTDEASAGNMIQALRTAWGVMREDRVIRLTVIGLVVYWGIVSMLGQNMLVFTDTITSPEQGFHPDSQKALLGVPMAVFGIGVAIGAIAAGRVSVGKIEFGLIPLGAILFALFTLILAVVPPTFWGTLVIMPFLGAASGLSIVPLNAILQWRAPADRRGAVIAIANLFMLFSVAVGSVGAFLLAVMNLDSSGVFLAGALMVVAATVWAVWLLPKSLVRLVVFLLTNTIYRVRVTGIKNIPDSGGVLLVANHVSVVDGLLIMNSLDRPVHFVVSDDAVQSRFLRWCLQSLETIEIASDAEPKAMLRSLKDAGEYLDRGEVVCIFPEGQLTRTGSLLPFRKEFERVGKGRDAVIIPIYLDRLWGSVFSHSGGRVFWKLPKQIPYRVQLCIGDPTDVTTPMREVRKAVHTLSEAAWRERMTDRPPLHRSFIKAMRRRRLAFAFGDERRPRTSRLGALTGTIALANALRDDWKGQQRVGIMLPPSTAAALVNFAASMSGRTSVNLNYTAGQSGLESAARQAKLKTVVTSREFLEKAKVELPDNLQPIWIDEVAQRITFGARFSAMMMALFGFTRQIERACGAEQEISVNDVVTIIFSSGSTGEPKGVELTHANVDANVEGCAQVFPLERNDRMLGILPLFHSFGYMTTWLAANEGVGVVFRPNPIDAPGIGATVAKERITILITTPTFLQLYLKRVTPPQFGSLRFVLTGAEKLSPRLAESFQQAFGILPIEGYGATECAPVVTVSTLDVRGHGVFQTGSRSGSVGHPLPGVALKLADPDSLEPLMDNDPETSGMLLVKGPNIMRGYLGKPDLTAEVVRDGWYVTGDVAQIDEDGFVRITGRLSRFSKIGGEMVPHGRVEEALQEAAGADVQVFAVTGVPDDKKGERLAILHTLDDDRIPTVIEKLGDAGLPNLFIPRVDQFIKVESLPMLGTGKLDLRAVNVIAADGNVADT